ncbi:hypothetical protein ACFQZJ_12285 [Maribacter chungangensis]|uniref:DUF423 domain-containing protein n=1 Tax=Maribacter chungangensis TaxID=1069117 RepID=A0ABW3B5U0_9FLAO
MKNRYIKIAGTLNLLTAFLHLIAGQIDLVNPLLGSSLTLQQKGELTGAWHIVTILLFYTAFIVLQSGFRNRGDQNFQKLKSLAIFYILSGIPFIGISVWFGIFAPQWILLMPIGVLLLFGLRKPTDDE